MPISDYQLVRGSDSSELQNKVRLALVDGWTPLGAPLSDGRNLLQAMTQELKPVSEAQLEAAKQLQSITTQAAEKLLAELQPEPGSDAGAAPAAETVATSVVKTTTKGKQ